MRISNLFILMVGMLGAVTPLQKALGVNLVFGCKLGQSPRPVNYAVWTDTQEATVTLTGKFLDATPPRPEQPVESITKLAAKNGLKGTLTKIDFKMHPCRWKTEKIALVGIECSNYDVEVNFTNDQGTQKLVRAKALTAEIERVTRESAFGTKQTYESSIMIQAIDDQIYRSIEIFDKDSCTFEG